MLNKGLIEAAETGDWSKIDLSKITKEMVSEIEEKDNRNIFHIAAANWHLDKIPKSLWDNELLLKTDKSASTVLHLAILRQQLNDIPKELLTKENLIKRNSNGWTVLAHIGTNYSLRVLPEELLTEEILTHNNSCCLALILRNLQISRDDGLKELLNDNIKIILTRLSKEGLKSSLENCSDKDVKPQMITYITKELTKRNLIEKVKDTNYIEI